MVASIGRLLIAASFFIGGIAGPTSKAHSQDFGFVLSGATAVLGSMTVKKIFDEINRSIDHAQKTFEGSGNRLLASGVEQSHLLLRQLTKELDGQREMLFQQLSNAQKLALWDLYNIAKKLEQGVADEFGKSMVQGDKLLAQLRFIGKDFKFLIVRVSPTVFQQHSVSTTPIRIFGIGLGTDQADKTFQTSIKLGNRLVPADRIARKDWGVEVFLDQEHLAPLWQAGEYARAPMVIESVITTPGGWWCRWYGCKKRDTYNATYHLDLYPTNPAKVTIKQRGQREVDTGRSEWTQISVETPDMHDQDHYATTPSALTYAGTGWKWVAYDQAQQHSSCVNLSNRDGCPFTKGHECHFQNDNTQAMCSLQNNGAKVRWGFGVLKKNVKMGQYDLPNVSLELAPGATKPIEISDSAKSAWIEGTLPTGKTFGPISLRPAGGKATDDVVCTWSGTVGDKAAFDCTLREVL